VSGLAVAVIGQNVVIDFGSHDAAIAGIARVRIAPTDVTEVMDAAQRLVDAIADREAVFGLARDGISHGWKAEMDAEDAFLCALLDTRTALDGQERPHVHAGALEDKP
jgi:hypothetical protein